MSTREPHEELSASNGPSDESVDGLVSDIEETRGEVTDTLGEIGDRLDPGHLVEQAKENVRDATIGRVEEAVETAGETARGLSDMVMETVKQNPIPTAIAGIALAWLWKNRADGQQQHRAGDYRYAGTTPGGRRYGYYDQSQWEQSQGGIGQKVGDAAGNVGQTVSGAAGTVAHTAGDMADNVGQTAGEVVERGQVVAQQAGHQFEEMLDANPLALGVIALGAGAAIGVLVPETSQENELLGDVSDKVTDAVGQTASQTIDKVEKVASKATDSVKQEARSEGLVK